MGFASTERFRPGEWFLPLAPPQRTLWPWVPSASWVIDAALMSHRHLLILLGVVLIVFGLIEGGWLLLTVWMGCDFLALGIAHARGAHHVLGKRPDGSLPLWSWLAFLPLLLYTSAVWHLGRLLSREPAYNRVAEDLVVGRRLLPGELEGDFANYVDLTAEFVAPAAIRRSAAYQCVPILDGSAPDPRVLREAVRRLRGGRTFIHCAQGHGRTGLFAAAVLLNSGAARTVNDALQRLQSVRPRIALSRVQRRCIEEFAAGLIK